MLDDGPGIPEEDWPRVIQPFVRGAGGSEGSGLGLAIVADVMMAHRGQLVFGRTDEGLFVVSLIFPLATRRKPKNAGVRRTSDVVPDHPGPRGCCFQSGPVGAGAVSQEVVRTFPAPGIQREVLTLDTATDLTAFEPLIRDFQRIAPDVTIQYREFVTNALLRRCVGNAWPSGQRRI